MKKKQANVFNFEDCINAHNSYLDLIEMKDQHGLLEKTLMPF